MSSELKIEAEVEVIRKQLEALICGQERLEQLLDGIQNRSLDTIKQVDHANGSVEVIPQAAPLLPPVAAALHEKDAKPSTVAFKTQGSAVLSEQEELEAEGDLQLLRQRAADREMMSASQSTKTFNRRKDRLKGMLELSESAEKERRNELQRRNTEESKGSLLRIPATDLEIYVNTVMSVVIVANAICIGVSLDHGSRDAWLVVDALFCTVFIIEFIGRIYMHGFYGYYCGADWNFNLFDFLVVVVDLGQLIASLIIRSKNVGLESRTGSLFRLMRISRIVRIIRVIRGGKHMKGLVDMIAGLRGGAQTLGWAITLFFMIVYVLSVMCRVGFGYIEPADGTTDINPYFDDLPRSMFTVFRCSFGDCNTPDGLSIPEHINVQYGGGYAVMYCGLVFFITIGLFNVISAIFVESTLSAATNEAELKKQQRLEDPSRLARNISIILKEMLAAARIDMNTGTPGIQSTPEAADINAIVEVEFSRTVIENVVHDDDTVKKALDALDIDPHDHGRLSDILDPDHSGNVGVLELVDGLRRLRGDPRRSDIVTVDLMVRSLQTKVDERCDEVLSAIGELGQVLASVTEKEAEISRSIGGITAPFKVSRSIGGITAPFKVAEAAI